MSDSPGYIPSYSPEFTPYSPKGPPPVNIGFQPPSPEGPPPPDNRFSTGAAPQSPEGPPPLLHDYRVPEPFAPRTPPGPPLDDMYNSGQNSTYPAGSGRNDGYYISSNFQPPPPPPMEPQYVRPTEPLPPHPSEQLYKGWFRDMEERTYSPSRYRDIPHRRGISSN